MQHVCNNGSILEAAPSGLNLKTHPLDCAYSRHNQDPQKKLQVLLSNKKPETPANASLVPLTRPDPHHSTLLFPQSRSNLPALYSACNISRLLSSLTIIGLDIICEPRPTKVTPFLLWVPPHFLGHTALYSTSPRLGCWSLSSGSFEDGIARAKRLRERLRRVVTVTLGDTSLSD
ncbi:uncharacterized protein K444DRAFT_278145 [Hyaloscypha bicolor E]|uniref:Uncharacterized protein n=1 Tax=Hyaloscypha bicolor E TaxID=1095630 RepID=A0A2J6SJH0_9HELO|nr:uncharacterized protein K444DRAFT_278145 [Hyaloscypha bicolor E]PMD50880.1 hypothetical protein K444DRAFT_278145 [Hyaloscypha bicolor E]